MLHCEGTKKDGSRCGGTWVKLTPTGYFCRHHRQQDLRMEGINLEHPKRRPNKRQRDADAEYVLEQGHAIKRRRLEATPINVVGVRKFLFVNPFTDPVDC